MSLENEYYTEKQMLKNAEEKLESFESLDDSKMTQEQIEAKERGIRRAKADIKESEEILSEIKEELKEFIANGGEVSESTLKELEDEDKIIRFKGSHIDKDNEEYIEGYMRLSDADSDNPLYFYDYEGFEVGNRYPDNPYHKEGEFNQWLDYEHLKLNMELDDDITQFLVDFADKNIKITRADFEYVLEINY